MPTLLSRFRFVSGQYHGSARAIGCDGLVPGAALDLTHWQHNRTPRAYKADTSTEIALKFADSPEFPSWSDAVVVNNHFDTDGALSCWTLLDPERARRHRELLVAAAEAGDFDEWPALDRGLWLDASVRALASGAGNDGDAYTAVLPQLGELIDTLDGRRDLWGAEWDRLQEAQAQLGAGQLRAWEQGSIGVLWHGAGIVEAPGPLLARQFLPRCRRYLLSFEQQGGRFHYRYERPRYAWAETVVRPPITAPDAEAIVRALGASWTTDELPGLTAIAQTLTPIDVAPEPLARQFGLLDPV